MSGIVGGINLRSSGIVNNSSAADGQLLTGTGAGLPAGFEAAASAAGLVYLTSQTAADDDDLLFETSTGATIDSTYGSYLFIVESLYHDTTAQELRLQVSNDDGGSWEGVNYYGGNIQWDDAGTQTTTKLANGAYLPLTDAQIRASAVRCSGLIYMHDPTTAATADNFTWSLTMAGNTGGTGQAHCTGGGGCNVTAQGSTDAVRFYPQAGCFTSGTIYLYGIVKS